MFRSKTGNQGDKGNPWSVFQANKENRKRKTQEKKQEKKKNVKNKNKSQVSDAVKVASSLKALSL